MALQVNPCNFIPSFPIILYTTTRFALRATSIPCYVLITGVMDPVSEMLGSVIGIACIYTAVAVRLSLHKDKGIHANVHISFGR